MNNTLEGKVAIVIGASKGIGKGIAEAISELHPKGLVLASRTQQDLDQVVSYIKKKYHTEALAIATDVTVPSQIDNLFAQTEKAYGKIDIVIHSGGLIQKDNEPLDTITDERILAINLTNLVSVEYVGKRALQRFRRQNSGIYLVISSEAGQKVYDNYEVYLGTKAGDNHVIRGLNETFKKDEISAYAFAVGPGLVDTPGAREAFPTVPESTWKKSQPIDMAREHIIPALTNPEEYKESFSSVNIVKTVNVEDTE